MSGQGNSAPRRAKDFEARVAGRLRESADGVDACTRSRLNRARQAALGELSAGPVRGRAPLMAGALAAAAVAAIAVVTWRPRAGEGLVHIA